MLKKVILFTTIIALFVACQSKKDSPVTENNNPKVVISEAIGVGDSEASALVAAKEDAVFRAFGKLVDSAGTSKIVADGQCVSDSIIEKSVDDVQMWTVKIKAVVQKNNSTDTTKTN